MKIIEEQMSSANHVSLTHDLRYRSNSRRAVLLSCLHSGVLRNSVAVGGELPSRSFPSASHISLSQKLHTITITCSKTSG